MTIIEAPPVLTPERLVGSPSLSGPRTRSAKFSPRGDLLTFLKAREDDSQRLDLWAFDVETGDARRLVDSKLLEPDDVELSEEEKALRERKRIAGTKGIVSYDWDQQGDKILVPIGGNLFLIDITQETPAVQQLTDTEAFDYNAKISPAGKYVSFIRGGAVYVHDLGRKETFRLSPEADPSQAISYGVAEFVAQEEMSRYEGVWWSPDDTHIAYTRVDESTVDIVPRFDIAAEDVTVIDQRYPRAGRPNAVVDLMVHEMESEATVQLALEASPDSYLARVNWSHDGSLFVQRVNRDQTKLELLKADMTTGAMSNAYTETQPHWINLSKTFTPLAEGGFLWTTEETGFRHITLHDDNGNKLRQVTSGDWVVSNIVGVDEANGMVYFTGFMDTPLEEHLYRTSIETSSVPEQITDAGGNWSVEMNKAASAFIATYSSPDQPPRTALYKTDGTMITWVEENALDSTHPYAPFLATHISPEFGTLTAEDGKTLHYSLLKPHDFDPDKSYPAILQVYGGPHVQRVSNDWQRLSNLMMAQQGYIVIQLDNRGTWNRGKAFEDVIFRQTGEVEVRDQLLAVDYLKQLDFVDAERIGINGWSYGGYMTLMTTLKAPEGTFAAAISGAPVSDWSLYDTFYTERYMDTPQDNPEGYEASSVFPHLHRLTTPLLMIHGMADDNVTFDNSTRVFAELQKMNKPFEMMTYPGERHGIADKDMQVHMTHTRLKFLARHLKPGE